MPSPQGASEIIRHTRAIQIRLLLLTVGNCCSGFYLPNDLYDLC